MWETLCKLKCLPPLIQSLLRATFCVWNQQFDFSSKSVCQSLRGYSEKNVLLKTYFQSLNHSFFTLQFFSLLQVDTALVVLLMCALQCHQQIFRFDIFAFSFSKKRVHRLWILNFLTSWQRGYIVFDLL